MRLQVANIESTVETLRQKSRALKLQQAKMRTPGVSTPHAHLVVSPERSPVKQVEWFSRRRIAAQARPAETPSFIASTPLRTPVKEHPAESSTKLSQEQVAQITKQLRSQVLSEFLLDLDVMIFIVNSPHIFKRDIESPGRDVRSSSQKLTIFLLFSYNAHYLPSVYSTTFFIRTKYYSIFITLFK